MFFSLPSEFIVVSFIPRYKPGDIVIFMAGDLYHAVGDWQPAERTEELEQANISSGRVSHVFFFPKTAVKALEGKAKNWATSTVWGTQKWREEASGSGSKLVG